MPAEVENSPPLHEPHTHDNVRPKGILKNPSFSAATDRNPSPEKHTPPSAALDPQAEKDLVLQNTLQNAGHRRSSSAARRGSNSRRHSSAAGLSEDDPDKQRLKWDEANLYLAEQEKGGRMKITEPKTPYQFGDTMEDEEEDVAIDPRYVNVDEVDLARNKKTRESEIPGLDIGEPEDELSQQAGTQSERIVRSSSLSREGSKEKHVSVGEGAAVAEQPGMPTQEEQEKHRQFEEQRKKHYEMSDVRKFLGHPERSQDDEDDEDAVPPGLPSRGINGTQ